MITNITFSYDTTNGVLIATETMNITHKSFTNSDTVDGTQTYTGTMKSTHDNYFYLED
jgi:hypothetical protein